jgi:hypothetical protein
MQADDVAPFQFSYVGGVARFTTQDYAPIPHAITQFIGANLKHNKVYPFHLNKQALLILSTERGIRLFLLELLHGKETHTCHAQTRFLYPHRDHRLVCYSRG